jgi:PAS domain S-box-containing protein
MPLGVQSSYLCIYGASARERQRISMKLAHALTDAGGRFLEVDDAFCQLVGRSREELARCDILGLTHPHDRGGNHEKLEALRREGTAFAITKRYLGPHAESIWVENHVSMFRDGGTIRPIATIRALDSTEAAAAERALAAPSTSMPAELIEIPDDLGALARAIQRKRERARTHLPPHVVGTPAYDMLLELAASEAEGRQVDITTLCLAADVSSTTGLRWTNVLEDQGLIHTVRCSMDRRRRLVRLSDDARRSIARYLGEPMPS